MVITTFLVKDSASGGIDEEVFIRKQYIKVLLVHSAEYLLQSKLSLCVTS